MIILKTIASIQTSIPGNQVIYSHADSRLHHNYNGRLGLGTNRPKHLLVFTRCPQALVQSNTDA